MYQRRLVSRLLSLIFLLCLTGLQNNCLGQNSQPADSSIIKSIYDYELVHGNAYKRLNSLCTLVGGRISGSAEAAKAVVWAVNMMKTGGFDSVYTQPVMVPHWVRGEKESAGFSSQGKTVKMAVCALGRSVATPREGLSAKIVEVKSIAELRKLDATQVSGRIVFFNGAFDQTFFNTGDAYSVAVDQRFNGASAAARLGALGVLVRSMSTITDDYPHTGSMAYAAGVKKIPACAISTIAADRLEKAFRGDTNLVCTFNLSCQNLADVLSYNVIAEIKGSQKPSDVIVVGGHLDSWDLAQGAQDDGAGVMQALEVLAIFKACHYKPQHTVRTVFFMSEEYGGFGGKEYARLEKKSGERTLAALESDDGGFTPRGFSLGGSKSVLDKMMPWEKLLKNYGSGWFVRGGEGGADVAPLQEQTKVLIGLIPDSQRYFDIHHTARDRMDMVNERELKLGAASMASLVYLLDHYGLE